MRTIRRTAAWCFLASAAALTAGCGGMVIPRGRLTQNGQPFRCENGVAVHMTFLALAAAPAPGSEDTAAYPAEYYRDGTFRVVGENGKGLPPGKYRVAVQAIKQKKDLLDGAYGAKNTPLTCEVKSAGGELHLELTQAGAATAASTESGASPTRHERAR